jgi:Na+-transporting NADH:ubiquinone oxidoreductase subunit A
VYLGIKGGSSLRDLSSDKIEAAELYGPHPVGNAGVMINHIKPVNKGETVWTMNAADVLFIGRLFNTGRVDFSRTIALTGSEMTERGYAKAIVGCSVKSLTEGKISETGDKHLRIISGNVLTGTKVEPDGFLGAYDCQITVIPEGDDVDEFVGWAMPGFGKYSVSRTYFSWLHGKNKEYEIDARIRGGERAMIMSNEYDRVFPMDILPEYLLKAIITFDIDKMENLGIYEVAPEDFALCEFVDTSKIEIQKIVRHGLDLLYKEMK